MATWVQQPLAAFMPAATWRPPIMAQLPRWADAKRISFDVETHDPRLRTSGKLKGLGPGVRRDGRMVGYSFAIEDGPAHYVPFAHEGGDNVDRDHALAYLRDQAASFRGVLVGANLSYDLDYAWQAGVNTDGVAWYRDPLVAEPLLDELQLKYSLDAVAARHGLPGKDETILRAAAQGYGVDPKRDLWRLPARYVGAYAEQDARLPLLLLRRQERLIDAQGLQGVFDLESRLLPGLVRMRRRGVRVNFDRVDALEKQALAAEAAAWAEVHRATGIRLDAGATWSAAALAPVLEAIGLHVPRTPTGGPSVDADLLGKLDHPVPKAIQRAREWNKLRTTFIARTREHAIGDRIHATIHQVRREKDGGDGNTSGGKEDTGGARYGRCSSSDPNLQQEPTRSLLFGKLWRAIYVPDHTGQKWICADYSQQEPRWAVHYGEVCGLPGAREMGDRYRSDPKADAYDLLRDLTGLPRKLAKGCSLGLSYGMGGAKLCRFHLNLPTATKLTRDRGMIEIAGEEGQRIIDKFNEAVPYIRLLSKQCSSVAVQRGYVRTIGGRHCHFPRDANGNVDFSYKALNRILQGSAGDQMKQALVNAMAEGYDLNLVVHDEIDYCDDDMARARRLAEIMRDAIPSAVPFRVDLEVGDDWGNIAPLAEAA